MRRNLRDRGQVAVEYLGFIPVLLIVGLAGIQLGAVAYAAEQAGTGGGVRGGGGAQARQKDTGLRPAPRRPAGGGKE
ncbi:hypothetical protein ACWGJB_14895, partial [Streptomyces sp. NPDC054813]